MATKLRKSSKSGQGVAQQGLAKGALEAGNLCLSLLAPSWCAEQLHLPEPEPAPSFQGSNRIHTSKVHYPEASGPDKGWLLPSD